MHESERRILESAYDFLLRVRTDLHYLARRSADALTLNFQGQIADRFGYQQKTTLRRSEAFMRDYYHHARAMALITETLFERLVENGPDAEGIRPSFEGGGPFGHNGAPTAEHFDGFISHGGMLYPEERDLFLHDPFRLLRVFEHAQNRNLRLSSEVQQLIRRRKRLVNRTFQYARGARETFISILSRRGRVGRVLRAMHEVDVLGAYLPEFGELTCLVQHEFFHRYSADEHTLVCIEKLDALLQSDDPKFANYRRLFENLPDPFILYLALLLHDTGKATSARHHAEASALFAQKVAARLQLSSERRRSLILLVDHHLTLSSTAQRRNLDDPATIAEFAQIVKDRANLDALMLLTLADGQGTSDEAWSDWKESLVWQLYNATRRYLADGEAGYLATRRERESQRRAVAMELNDSFTSRKSTRIFIGCRNGTSRSFDACGHRRPSALAAASSSPTATNTMDAEAALAPAIRWKPQPERGHTECWVCTWERRGLLAKIAGSFAAAGLEHFLSADIYTRGDNSGVRHFPRLRPDAHRRRLEPRDLASVEGTLAAGAARRIRFDFQPLLQKARRRRRLPRSRKSTNWIFRRARSSPTKRPTCTRCWKSRPRTGSASCTTCCVRSASSGINVVLSRIATEKGAAVDSFYVTDQEGERITDAWSDAKDPGGGAALAAVKGA